MASPLFTYYLHEQKSTRTIREDHLSQHASDKAMQGCNASGSERRRGAALTKCVCNNAVVHESILHAKCPSFDTLRTLLFEPLKACRAAKQETRNTTATLQSDPYRKVIYGRLCRCDPSSARMPGQETSFLLRGR